MTCKLNADFSLNSYKRRFRRILIPYMVWTVIYLIAKIIMFSALHQQEQLKNLLKDPFAIIFTGDASFHLYYLPLLLAGTSLIIFGSLFTKPKIGLKILASLSLVSLILYNLLITTGNSFLLVKDMAFENFFKMISFNVYTHHILRFISIEIAWIVRCLPYFFIAMTLRYLLIKTNFSLLQMKFRYTHLFLGLFIIVDILGNTIPSAFSEVLLGYSLLLYGIVLSNHVKASGLIQNLGLCSFGIYLIHPFAINILEIIFKKSQPHLLDQVTVVSQLAFSVPTFMISWLAVSLLMKNKVLVKYLFSA